MNQVLLHNGTVFEGTGRDAKPNTSILILGNEIGAIGPSDSMEPPEGTEVIDVGGRFIMPGMFNNHVHLGWTNDRHIRVQSMEDPDFVTAAVVIRNMQIALEAGLTSVRDLGMNDAGYIALDLQRRRLATGPRLHIAGRSISITGGHCWWCSQEADGPDAVRQAVREQLKGGADVIKIMANGSAPEFTVDELKAAADEAHARNCKITAHATIPKAIDKVLEAGFDCIEHGGPFTEQQIERMVEDGVFVVPTLSTGYVEPDPGLLSGMSPEEIRARRERLRDPVVPQSLRKARRAGVPLCLGNDAGGAVPFSNVVDEIRLLVELGVVEESADALLVATHNGARLNGVSETLGTLEVGKLADVVVVDGDPLTNIRDVANIDQVFLDGRRVV